LALQRLGLQPWSYEIERDCIATLRAAGHRAVRVDLAGHQWDPAWRGEVGVMHGSPPCQPWSASGKGHGREDVRDGMPWMLVAVEALMPLLVTVENVEGLTYRKHADYLAWFVASLQSLGYTVEWRVLNAADYGVPQTRKRLIIVGRLEGEVRWPRATHGKEAQDDVLPWVSMASALGWGLDSPTRTVCGNREPRWAFEVANSYGTGRTLVGFPRRADGRDDGVVLNGETYRARDLFDAGGPAQTVTEKGRSWQAWTLNTGNDWKPGGDRSTAQRRELSRPAPSITGKSGGQWVLQPGTFADGRPGGVGKRRTYAADLEPAPTVALGKDVAGWVWRRPATTVSGDTRIHPPGHRENAAAPGHKRAGPDAYRLSVAELAVLQDMPPDYPFAGTKTSAVRQIGNALPPTMLQAVIGANLWPPRWPVA
jgi:DNA (cytosine-5)-methyltransferase 1